MVRNGLVQFHVKCTGISIKFITEKTGSSFSINSEIIIKEIIWLMKAPRLSLFILFWAIDSYKMWHWSREPGIWVKGYMSPLSSDSTRSCSGWDEPPLQQGYWIPESRRQRNHCSEICSLILQSCSYNPRLRNTAAGITVVMPLSVLGLRLFWTANSSYPGRLFGRPANSFSREKAVSQLSPEVFGYKGPHFWYVKKSYFSWLRSPEGRDLKAMGKGHSAEVTF